MTYYVPDCFDVFSIYTYAHTYATPEVENEMLVITRWENQGLMLNNLTDF